MNKYQIAQVTERNGQGCIALIRNGEIIGRYFDYTEARAALKALRL
jgi:hypothetical protein